MMLSQTTGIAWNRGCETLNMFKIWMQITALKCKSFLNQGAFPLTHKQRHLGRIITLGIRQEKAEGNFSISLSISFSMAPSFPAIQFIWVSPVVLFGQLLLWITDNVHIFDLVTVFHF